jgi:hypothetical protein
LEVEMSRPSSHRLSPGAAATAGVLLAVPILALLLVPLYARTGPELWGFPFFYWYQLLWVVICGAFTGGAHWVIARDRRDSRNGGRR